MERQLKARLRKKSKPHFKNVILLSKNNILENVHEVKFEDICFGLLTYDMFDKLYPEKISFEDCLLCYLANDDGLSSTFDDEDFQKLKMYCWTKFNQEKNLV